MGAAVWSAIAASQAAKASFKSARETRLAVQAQLLAEFLREYSFPKMKNALRRLRAIKQAHPTDFVEVHEPVNGHPAISSTRRVVTLRTTSTVRIDSTVLGWSMTALLRQLRSSMVCTSC
jgi:hypothetical protein